MILLTYLKKKGFFNEFSDKRQLKTDILSGLTVALALIPEAIAFSFVAKVNPMIGLYAAFIVGLLTAIFGGRPGMISGATGAMAIIMTPLVLSHGVEYLFAAVILTGLLQIIFGILKLGKVVRLIPHPVMLGFVNGLALIILLAQVGQFQVPQMIDGKEVMTWIGGQEAIIMALLIFLTMGIIYFLPKFTKAIPSGLVAIITVTLLVSFVPQLEGTRTVSSYLIENGYNGLSGGFPIFSIPKIEVSFIEMLKIILPYAFVLAIIGLTESLMTLSLIDEKTDTRGNTNKESIGQGIANTTCGFFGAMGGCAMIGQSMINLSNGGRGRASGISAAIFLIIFIVFFSIYIGMIPLAALVGLMFMVVIGTFAWPTLKMLNKIPRSDSFILIAVTCITVYTKDLAIAVVSGVVISALVFAWQKSTHIEAKIYTEKNITHYELDGPLFFGAIEKFKELFNPKNDEKEVIIDFAKSRVMDHSAIEAINNLSEKYKKLGKKLHLKHLSKDCRRLIKNAEKIVDINVLEDPHYSVSSIYKKAS